MKPAFKVLAKDGEEATDKQLLVVRDMILHQALQTMMIYGVSAVEMNEHKVGDTYVLSPRLYDLKVEGSKRPKSLAVTRNKVFTHWTQLLFLYGITRIEMNPNEKELERIKELWKEANKLN